MKWNTLNTNKMTEPIPAGVPEVPEASYARSLKEAWNKPFIKYRKKSLKDSQEKKKPEG